MKLPRSFLFRFSGKVGLLGLLLMHALGLFAQALPGELLLWWSSPQAAKERVAELQKTFPHLHIQDIQTLSQQPYIQQLRFDTAMAPSLDQLLQVLHNDPAVFRAQANHIVQWRSRLPSDPLFSSSQRTLQHIGATEAWTYGTGGLSPNGDTLVVAVIDSGCDFAHEDLQGNLWFNWADPINGLDDDANGYVDDFRGWDVTDNDNSHDLGIHGTPVVGIIGARGDNNLGIAGLNWQIKVMVLSGDDNGPDGLNTEAAVIRAYSYILDMRRLYNESVGTKGAYVVASNASFGINNADAADYPIWCAFYDTLGQAGILNIGATANNNVNVDAVGDMPSTCPSDYLLAVTNTTLDDELNPAAAFGARHIDLGAPGNGSWTTRIFDDYGNFGGTSAAAPLVTGSVALLYAYPNPWWADLQRRDPPAAARVAKEILLRSTVRIPDLENRSVSGGRLELSRLIPELQDYFRALNEAGALRIFPNPSRENLQFEVEVPEEGLYEIEVFNVLGQRQYQASQTLNAPQVLQSSIPCQEWSAGVYFLRIQGPRDEWQASFIKP